MIGEHYQQKFIICYTGLIEIKRKGKKMNIAFLDKKLETDYLVVDASIERSHINENLVHITGKRYELKFFHKKYKKKIFGIFFWRVLFKKIKYKTCSFSDGNYFSVRGDYFWVDSKNITDIHISPVWIKIVAKHQTLKAPDSEKYFVKNSDTCKN